MAGKKRDYLGKTLTTTHIEFLDENGVKVSEDWLPSRALYRSRTGDYIMVTKNNRDYRMFVTLKDPGDGSGKHYHGTVRLPEGTNKSNMVKTSVTMEKDQAAAMRKIAKRDGITIAETIRTVIEWGLETVEREYGLELSRD